MQSPLLSRSRSPFERCEEDQTNEFIFFDAMYGQDDPNIFRVVKNKQSAAGFVFVDEDLPQLEASVDCRHVFEHRITSESPTPITQLCVRLQFRLVTMYPIEPPLIGCKSLIGASRQQCIELVKYLRTLALERTGQIMLFDLILAAGDWLNARVAESNQGSLHESMMEAERLRKVDTERKLQENKHVSEHARKVESSLDHLTLEQESQLRNQWLLTTADNSSGVPLRGSESKNFAGNLSYTMSRFMKAHGSNPFRSSGGNTNKTTSSSLLQTVYVLQQDLLQQQTLVAHLVAQWLTICKSISGEEWTASLIEYLESEGLIDERQKELVQFPGRIPVSALFPNATGSSPATGFISTPAEKLSSRLSQQAPRVIVAEDSGQPEKDNAHGSTVVKSRYEQDFEQLEYLGSGAFGDVWKVRNRLDGIYYAVKRVQICRIKPNESASKLIAENKDVNRILREVTTLGRIQSPYVLRYHQAWIEECAQEVNADENRRLRARGGADTLRSDSFFEDNNFSSLDALEREDREPPTELSCANRQLSLCIQTAYCPRTLSDFLKNEGMSAPLSELWRLCRMMLEGLAHIHSHGIMHRDMKPSNIFIDSNGDIRIGDFGLATFEGKNDEGQHGQSGNAGTEHSRHIGTKLYASPEQEGEEECGEYDERTDIYSLGIIFFELWHPFRTSYERIEQLSRLKEGIFPAKFVESHPRQWKLITLMIKRNIQDRPTATTVLQSDLLPPRMEDDFLNDALRVVANPNTPVFPRILEKLFSPNRQSILSKPPGKLNITQSIAVYTSFLPETVVLEQRKAWLSGVLRGAFERHGAVRVPSPIFTTITPESKIRDDEVTLMDHSGSLLGLRYDSRSFFTETITEAYANPHSSLVPDVLFKRYDIGSIFRKPTRLGIHPVELIRADFDIVGVDPLSAEAECLCVSSEILKTFDKDIEWVRIRMSHVKLFAFIMEQADIDASIRPIILKAMTESANTASSCTRIERWEAIRKALLVLGGVISEKQVNVIGRWFRTSTGTVSEAITTIRDHINEDDFNQMKAVSDLEDLMVLLEHILGAEFREKEFMLDMCSPAPSEDYDGIFFRVDVAFTANPEVGDVVAMGGRFDSTLRKIPESNSAQMVGVSWSVSKLISHTTVPAAGILSSPDVLLCAMYDSKADETLPANQMKLQQLALAAELWRSNISADVFYGGNSWQEQQEFAMARGVRYIILLREREIVAGLDAVTIRGDLDYNVYLRVLTGSKGKQAREHALRRSEIVNYLSHRSDK